MSKKLRIEVLVTVDELNQYLNGNVTKIESNDYSPIREIKRTSH